LHGLRVIFAVENNLYSCYTHISERQPWKSWNTFERIADAHNLAYSLCIPNDIVNIAEQIRFAKQTSSWPMLIEIPTYRYVQHCGPDNDDNLGYRGAEELAEWKDLDPVMVNKWSGNEHQLNLEIDKIRIEIDQAFNDVKLDPYPEKSEIGRYVYASS